MIRRRRLRAGDSPGSCSRELPLVVLLLLISGTLLADSAVAQTTWLMTQTPIGPSTARTHLHDRTINHRWVPSDPIPAGMAVRDAIVVPEVAKIEYFNNGGVTVDRYRGRVWTTSGDKDNLVFVSIPIDSDDPNDREIVSDIGGTYPFASNIDGITIMYGFNGRPKYMWCVSFTEYSYIKMRGDNWEWAPIEELKSIPGDDERDPPLPPYPVSDVTFSIVETREDGQSEWVAEPSLIVVERYGLVSGFNPFKPEAGKQFTTGTGLFNNVGIAVDTSQPETVIWDHHNDRRITGRLLACGELDGQRYVKDIENRRGWPVSGLGAEVLGLAYSAEITPLTVLPLDSTSDITAEVMRGEQSPQQPLMRLASGERQPIRIEAKSATDLSRYDAYFVTTLNFVPFDPMTIAQNPEVGIKGADFVVKGQRDPGTGKIFVNFDPSNLPVSPIPFDQMYYYYGQWLFVAPGGGAGGGPALPTQVSDPVRIAFSNAQ